MGHLVGDRIVQSVFEALQHDGELMRQQAPGRPHVFPPALPPEEPSLALVHFGGVLQLDSVPNGDSIASLVANGSPAPVSDDGRRSREAEARHVDGVLVVDLVVARAEPKTLQVLEWVEAEHSAADVVGSVDALEVGDLAGLDVGLLCPYRGLQSLDERAERALVRRSRSPDSVAQVGADIALGS